MSTVTDIRRYVDPTDIPTLVLVDLQQEYCEPAGAPFCQVMECCGGNFVLAGFAGETACLATAVDAFSRGHRFTFLADASASHRLDEVGSNDVHQVVTKVIELYGDVLGTRTWISATSRTRLQRRVIHGSEHDYSA